MYVFMYVCMYVCLFVCVCVCVCVFACLCWLDPCSGWLRGDINTFWDSLFLTHSVATGSTGSGVINSVATGSTGSGVIWAGLKNSRTSERGFWFSFWLGTEPQKTHPTEFSCSSKSQVSQGLLYSSECLLVASYYIPPKV